MAEYHDVSLFHKDYFELKTSEKQQNQEKRSLSPSHIPKCRTFVIVITKDNFKTLTGLKVAPQEPHLYSLPQFATPDIRSPFPFYFGGIGD